MEPLESLIVWLSSDNAASITGVATPIDGGYAVP